MELKKVTEQMREQLRKPLPPEAVSKHPTKTYLSSIKAIYVFERLNDVFGIGSYIIKSKEISCDSGFPVVKVRLRIPEYGIDLSSYGGNDNGGANSKNYDLGDAYKGAMTDAITKICSWLEIGIGVFKGQNNAPQPSKVTTPAKQENGQQAAPKEEVKPAVRYASARQKEEIIRLLNNPMITTQEKTKMLLNINRFDEQRASEAIEKLKGVIEDRENQAEHETNLAKS